MSSGFFKNRKTAARRSARVSSKQSTSSSELKKGTYSYNNYLNDVILTIKISPYPKGSTTSQYPKGKTTPITKTAVRSSVTRLYLMDRDRQLKFSQIMMYFCCGILKKTE